MILIVEGMDNCGKSTLIRNLRKEFFQSPRTIVHHSSSPPRVDDPNSWEIAHYHDMIQTADILKHYYGYNVIFDRFHLGSIVYGKKFRGMNEEPILELDNLYLSHNKDYYLIVLTDYPKNIKERDDGLSLEKSIDDYEYTRNEFIRTYEKSSCMNKLHLNITDNGGFENLLPIVTEFLTCNKKD